MACLPPRPATASGLPQPRHSRRAIALVVVLVAAVCMLAFFAGFQFFSRTEYRHLERILTNTSLDYLVRAGLNIAEDKLQHERWYGDSRTRGVFEVPSQYLPPQARITIYADDYARAEPRIIGSYKYYMLDHIKVYVEASLRDRTMYGFGKFIMSPEPLFLGKSTQGVDVSFQTTNPASYTFRKMIHVKLLREDDLENIPNFVSLSDFNSRKAMARHIVDEMHLQAKNYARNLLLSRKIKKNLTQTQPTCSLGDLRSLLGNLGGASLPNYSDHQLLNHFILENLKNFFMTTNWVVSERDKEEELRKVRIEIGHFPPDELNSETRRAIQAIFGPPHPKEARPGIDFFPEVRAGPNGSAFAEFLLKQGITAPPDKSPADFQAELCRAITDYDYTCLWQANGVWVDYPGPHGPSSPTRTVCEGGATAFLMYWENRNNPEYFNFAVDGAGVKISQKTGPILRRTNYYLVKPPIFMPLAMVFNFFMKYVDESYTYIPDAVVKNEDNFRIQLPPEESTGSADPDWAGLSG
ncbi:MAG: hypothetical protein OZSIB_1129 [Candidatus Ozemobacter sibiricus]|uniref:Uncharacterized protein n=1 Tax=Candidatus Ozemobacter sibiricus TaxID=2268124 RepID=A0A367ZL01_9BACT|nr:MAG: hypothetical protein OZSIB_1129 [Candidatus Ozemobacter sibiricus]